MNGRSLFRVTLKPPSMVEHIAQSEYVLLLTADQVVLVGFVEFMFIGLLRSVSGATLEIVVLVLFMSWGREYALYLPVSG